MSTDASRTTQGRAQRYDSIVDTIGNTPCVRVNHLAPDHVNLYVKAEFFNPAASVKDRLAISIIEEAERRGDLKPGQTVVEATSGNTGIGLALVCAVKGYKLVLTMPESMSLERRALLSAYGAEIVLTPAERVMEGAIEAAQELVRERGEPRIVERFRPVTMVLSQNEIHPKVKIKTLGQI